MDANCEMLFSKNPPNAVHYCSWLVFGTSTLQLVGFHNKHSAVSGFFELARLAVREFLLGRVETYKTTADVE